MMRIQRRVGICVAFMIVALVGVASVFAQQPPPDSEPKIEQDVIIVGGPELPPGPEGAHIALPPPDVMISGPAGGPIEGNTFTFVSSEMSFDGHVVKGAPYSAEAVTEMTQTLGDGNRIVRRSTASVYRDGEGRTRRDQTLGAIGPFAAAGDPPQTFFINDPVAGFNFILDPRTRTARKLPLPRIENLSRGARPGVKIENRVIQAPAPGAMGTGVMVYESVEGEPGPFHAARRGPKPKTEALGKQMIEGVEAEGTRTTITIPAGQIGNERPIQIVNERWYSPELQTVVMTKNTDPLVGESVYRLTNINRNEPPRSLFEVPADYKLRQVPPPPGIRIMRRPANDR